MGFLNKIDKKEIEEAISKSNHLKDLNKKYRDINVPDTYQLKRDIFKCISVITKNLVSKTLYLKLSEYEYISITKNGLSKKYSEKGNSVLLQEYTDKIGINKDKFIELLKLTNISDEKLKEFEELTNMFNMINIGNMANINLNLKDIFIINEFLDKEQIEKFNLDYWNEISINNYDDKRNNLIILNFISDNYNLLLEKMNEKLKEREDLFINFEKQTEYFKDKYSKYLLLDSI